MNTVFPEPTVDDPLIDAAAARSSPSRANGSRGPATAAGKERSSQNAIKHGLLAKRIAPLPDFRHERDDFEQQLHCLRAEFQPQTQTQVNLVELLARDWVRLGRIAGAIEAASIPPGLQVSTFYTDESDAQRGMALIDRLRRCLQRQEGFAVESEQLSFASNFLAYCLDEARGTPAVKRAVPPRVLGISCESGLRAILASNDPRPEGHRRGWTALFDLAEKITEGKIVTAREEQIRQERECRVHNVRVLREQLQHLQLLQEYETQVRRSISKNMQMLRESHALLSR